MSHSESKELIKAKELVNEGKFNEVFQLMKNFEKMGDISRYNLVSWHLLKCDILVQQGAYIKLNELAEQTYKESLGLGKSLLSVDALYYWALALMFSRNLEKTEEIIKQGEELLKTLSHELPKDYKQREAYIEYLKGLFYSPFVTTKSDPDLALEHFEQCLALHEEYGDKYEVAEILFSIGLNQLLYKGELDKMFEYVERALTLAKESNRKFTIARCLFLNAGYYYLKGELDRCVMSYEQSLVLFKELNNIYSSATILNNVTEVYRMKGEIERALECSEQAVAQNRETGNLKRTANAYDYLIHILIEKGDLERAQKKLDQLEQMKNELNDKQINLTYLFDKALLLKTSSRALNRGEAEKILKQVLEEDKRYEAKILVLLNLSELLLIDLQMTGDLEVLNDINSYIAQLMDITEKSRSYWVLGETYLLQAKLALIALNLKKARRLLTKGQQIADNHGLGLLAMKISNEHDELLKQLEMWEKLKESKAPLAERMELSKLNEQMERMVRKKVVIPHKLEVDQPILLTVMSKEGNTLLSNPFTTDLKIDSTYVSEFLSSCNTFCDQILSESFDRVKFGQHTVLITALNSFSICYMFQGQTYSAQQKIRFFSEVLIKDNQIMEVLKNAKDNEKMIELSDNPLLEEMITKTFLSDPKLFQMPFVAYRGDGPFVFASYAHADKLDVYPIIDHLNNKNIKIWYDEGIPVSENWKRSIALNLERCKTFLVFISPQILKSEYVKKEISFALKKHKPFFAVYLKDTTLPTELEFELADIQAMMKFLMPKTEFYSKLKDLLTNSLNI